MQDNRQDPITVDPQGHYILTPQWVEALPFILASRHFSRRVQEEAGEIAQRIQVRLLEDPPPTLERAIILSWGLLKGISKSIENQAGQAMVDRDNGRHHGTPETLEGREDTLVAACEMLPMIEARELFDTLKPQLRPWLAWTMGWDARPMGGHQHELNSLSGIRTALRDAMGR